MAIKEKNFLKRGITMNLVQSKKLTDAHIQELEQRKIRKEVALSLGIESQGDSIFIPYYRNGELVNYKLRTLNAEKRMSMQSGGTLCLWNIDCLNQEMLKDQPIIITEGELDAVVAIQAGFQRAMSVPNGAPNQESEDLHRYDYLDEFIDRLEDDEIVYIASDNDRNGRCLLGDLSRKIGRSRCKWVKYPLGCKDFNDAVIKYGDKAVKKCIANAQWVEISGYYRMEDLPLIPDEKCYTTGMGIDKNLLIRRGDFTVVTGIPSHGKTTFTNDIACRMAEIHNWNVAFASFEQHPTRDHLRNLIRWKTGKDQSQLSDEEYKNALRWINSKFSFIYPSDYDLVDFDWVLEKAQACVVRHNSDMLIIDPWNEIDHCRGQKETLTEYTGRAIKEFKLFARRNNVHVVIVAHPIKLARNSKGIFPKPTLYDISDSSHWYNKSDLGIVVHKESEEVSVIDVQKVKYHGIIGKPGEIRMSFDSGMNRFSVVNESSVVYSAFEAS